MEEKETININENSKEKKYEKKKKRSKGNCVYGNGILWEKVKVECKIVIYILLLFVCIV